MRREGGGGGGGGHYGGDSIPQHGYVAGPPGPHIQQHQQHHHQQQQSKSDHHQWRWEREGSKVPRGTGQGAEASRSYYQGQRPVPRISVERQGSYDAHAQAHRDEMDIRYEQNPHPQTFEVLEQKFLDDIMKLSKEQNDAEDAEISRHRERIIAINAQYQEQIVALRARHASRRGDFLRRESHSRQQQFQQAAVDNYPSLSEAQGYNAVAGPPSEPSRTYNADNYDPYRGRGRLLGNSRNHDPEPEAGVQYPGGRVYDTASRYY